MASKCYVVTVDGTEVRVQGTADPSPEAAAAIAAVIRAAQELMDKPTTGDDEPVTGL